MRRSRFSADAIIGILKEHASVAPTHRDAALGANGRFRKAASSIMRVIDRQLRAVLTFVPRIATQLAQLQIRIGEVGDVKLERLRSAHDI
ncbi:hypothetical protein [Paenirhodobacter hankyongi]|uniref:hypothetical protein n=1 Tax=Paenirhodobacter hankyongi TaxID=2294033 RepID=UPI0015FFFD86|nr:hypothetical protein [Sinirhodobacter hankyongi]